MTSEEVISHTSQLEVLVKKSSLAKRAFRNRNLDKEKTPMEILDEGLLKINRELPLYSKNADINLVLNAKEKDEKICMRLGLDEGGMEKELIRFPYDSAYGDKKHIGFKVLSNIIFENGNSKHVVYDLIYYNRLFKKVFDFISLIELSNKTASCRNIDLLYGTILRFPKEGPAKKINEIKDQSTVYHTNDKAFDIMRNYYIKLRTPE